MFMHSVSPTIARAVPTVAAACMALLMLAVRMKAAKKPTSLRKIIVPPFAMSTGFLMFVFPSTHITLTYAFIAFVCGLIMSVPLIKTSKFHWVEGQLYLKRSRAFAAVLLGLLALRLLLHSYVEEYVTIPQTGAVFFLLAFGMILMWRLAMVRGFLHKQAEN